MAEEYNRRSVKTLNAAKAASAHQKEWFLSLRERVANGEPLLFGMPPLEVVHAMDIPCIVTVWWTALCSAKQYGKQMYGFLDDAGYRVHVERWHEGLLSDQHRRDGGRSRSSLV